MTSDPCVLSPTVQFALYIALELYKLLCKEMQTPCQLQ